MRSALLLTLCAAGCGCGAEPIPAPRQPWQQTEFSSGARTPERATAHASPAAGDNPLDAEYASSPAIETLRGRASYYHDSLAGNTTANGDIYDLRAYTAASRDLAFGTIVRVVRIDNQRSVVVRVNDRGPFGDHRRILDLSRAAAEALDMIRAGVTDIRAEIVHRPE